MSCELLAAGGGELLVDEPAGTRWERAQGGTGLAQEVPKDVHNVASVFGLL